MSCLVISLTSHIYQERKQNRRHYVKIVRFCSKIFIDQGKPSLQEIHTNLCRPWVGLTRLYHWIMTKNLPFSIEEVRQVASNCHVDVLSSKLGIVTTEVLS